ncbi:hypothetical protein DL95DRAFT_345079, partial [Leptodontidium sp. 2 PMI_412]
MAEGLGVAASIAGLLTIADVVVRKGYKFIKNVKEAEESVTKLVEEVNNLSGALHSLNNIIERLEEDHTSFDPSTQIHCIESCYKTLTKIQGHFDQAVPSTPLSKGDKIRWPLKNSQMKELLVEIERHKATMTLAMTAKEMSALLEVLAQQNVIREGIQGIRLSLEEDRAERQKVVISDERRTMLQALGNIDARKWQDSNIRLRQPGTGIWFTDGPEFKTWLSTNQSKLWINGIPGAGKTILMSSIIQEIEKNVDSSHVAEDCSDNSLAMAFFYCDYKNPQTHDPSLILGSLARQLIVQDERGFAQLSEFIEDHTANDGTSRTHTPEELCELIRNLSKYSQTTLIIVDGLDEIANGRADVTKLLGSLNTMDGLIKTLFASRLEIDIGYQLEDYFQVSIAAMSSDLRLYVASEIERRTRERKLRIQDRSLNEHIMKTLVDGADGMNVLTLLAKISQTNILSRFRWVACQMDYLCECNNDRDRREALRKLPPDLPSSYERILERANRSNKENQELVKKVLHWIVYAVEPIPTDQLLQALAVREDEELFDSSAVSTEEELLHWCSSLVRRNSRSGQLELAHFTVKEFLQSTELEEKQYFRQYRLSGDHTVLAKACLGFLRCRKFGKLPAPKAETTYDEFWDQWLGISNVYSFINYSCRHWTYHVHESKWDKVEINVWKVFDSVDVLNFWTSGWMRIHFSADKTWPHYEQHLVPTSLHWAAIFALDKLCVKLVADGLDVSQPSAMGTPLHCTILAEQAPRSITRTSESVRVLTFLPESTYPEMESWRHDARESVLQLLIDAGTNIE